MTRSWPWQSPPPWPKWGRDSDWSGWRTPSSSGRADAWGFRLPPKRSSIRRYRPDGTLVPRGEPGAIIDSATDATAQAVSIVVEGGVRATDGSWLPIAADTICIHGDTAGAPVLARRVRAALEAAGVEVRPLR